MVPNGRKVESQKREGFLKKNNFESLGLAKRGFVNPKTRKKRVKINGSVWAFRSSAGPRVRPEARSSRGGFNTDVTTGSGSIAGAYVWVINAPSVSRSRNAACRRWCASRARILRPSWDSTHTTDTPTSLRWGRARHCAKNARGAALVRGGAMTVGRDATMVALAFALRPR